MPVSSSTNAKPANPGPVTAAYSAPTPMFPRNNSYSQTASHANCHGGSFHLSLLLDIHVPNVDNVNIERGKESSYESLASSDGDPRLYTQRFG